MSRFTKEELQAEKARREAEAQKGNIIKNNIARDVASASAEITQTVMKDNSLTETEKEETIRNMSNKKAVQNSVDRNFDKPDAKQGSGLKDQFLDALTFFGPQLIGGYLASGGKQDEYFVAGFEQGGKMRDAYLAQKNVEADREQRERQFQQRQNQELSPYQKQSLELRQQEIDMQKEFEERRKAGQRLRERGFGLSEKKQQQSVGKDIDNVAKEFRNPKMPSGKAISALSEMDNLKNLLDSNTKIRGLIEFKMAKGIAQEVGNLTEAERQEAAQIVGIKGDLLNFQEWLTSEVSAGRKEEIYKLIKYMKPRLEAKVKKLAQEQATGAGQFYGMEDDDIAAMILRRAQAGVKVKKSKKPVVNDRAKKLLDRLNNL